MADIFISCTGRDRDWAFWISKRLRALGRGEETAALHAKYALDPPPA